MTQRRWHVGVALALAALLGAGCASNTTGMGYYWQSVTGHLQLMQAARPVDDWLADASAPASIAPPSGQTHAENTPCGPHSCAP